MKRFAFFASLCLLLFGFGGRASAQFLPDVPDMKGRAVYGGNFGFGINGGRLSLSIAPQIGYRVFNPWEIGTRVIYDLNCYFDRVNGNVYSHYFGVAPYTNVQVYRGLFLHAEDEILYGVSRWNQETVRSRWYNSVFVGGGYRSYSYNGSFAYFMVLYNLSWNAIHSGTWESPYASPISVRVGYCF